MSRLEEAARILLQRRKARKNLIEFAKATMPDYRPGWHHVYMDQAIERMVDGDLRRLIVSMPPRHGKSELISRRLPAYLLGRNPDETIITASYSAELASRMNRDCQRIMTTPQYRAIFPETKLNETNSRTTSGSWLRNSDVFEIVGRKGSYRSAGVGGGITGMGARWLIVDDPIKNREEADSNVYREKVWDWYTSTFYTRQAPDARILIVMTRWHTDDLAGRLIKLAEERAGADQWEVINFPAIAKDPGKGDPRQPGEALWPEMYPVADLQRIRESIGEYQWTALYGQEPQAGGGVEWPPDYFPNSILFDEWPDKSAVTMRSMAVDPSKGADAKHGDFSAIVYLARTVDGTLWIDADLERRPTEKIVQDVIQGWMAFQPEVLGIEANQFQELLITQILQEAKKQQVPMGVTPIINNVGKKIRIRRLGPYFHQKQVRIRNTPGGRLLLAQLRDFPTADHDDGPDGAEMALRCMVDLHNSRAQRATGVRRIRT